MLWYCQAKDPARSLSFTAKLDPKALSSLGKLDISLDPFRALRGVLSSPASIEGG